MLAQQLDLTNNFWYSNNIANHLSYTNLSASSTNWSYSSNNWSYYGSITALNLVANVNTFAAPTDASNALFIVWVNDADFVDYMGTRLTPTTNNITPWTNAINQSHDQPLASHHQSVLRQRRFARCSCRTPWILPKFPVQHQFASANKSFIRQRVIDFNVAFTAMLSNAMASCPGLKIYEPDFFSLLDDILTNAAAYGLTNALHDGQSICTLI